MKLHWFKCIKIKIKYKKSDGMDMGCTGGRVVSFPSSETACPLCATLDSLL